MVGELVDICIIIAKPAAMLIAVSSKNLIKELGLGFAESASEVFFKWGQIYSVDQLGKHLASDVGVKGEEGQ